jgi:hypothetical protein
MDYISLFKTRLVLRWMVGAARRTPLICAALIADFFAYVLIIIVGFQYFLIMLSLSLPTLLYVPYIITLSGWLRALPGITFIYQGNDVGMTAFWGGFAPSAWLWFYVAALLATRAFLRSETLVNRLRWFLDIEKNAFRSIGAVAAGLAFVGSAIVVLVAHFV